MKKTFSLIMIAVIVLIFAACGNSGTESSFPPSESAPSSTEPAERLGFSGGNIGAGGLLCGGDDGYIYFRNEEDWKLYKVKPDGSEKAKLSDHMPERINVLDGWVYFRSFTDGSIYKVRTNGTDETWLADSVYGNLFIAESGMYFNARDEKNVSHVYRADLDGGNKTLLFRNASIMYYYNGKIYLGSGQLGVYEIETSEEKLLDNTFVANVSVDDSGIYYWAYDENEFRRMDLDGSNKSVILHGGDFFNYIDGYLYYMGIGENANGPCHLTNRLNVGTGEIETLYEALNEFFDISGNLLGITFRQLNEGDFDPDRFEYDNQGVMVLKGGGDLYSESLGYVFVVGEHLFMQASLRESIFQNGRFTCIARLDGGIAIWN